MKKILFILALAIFTSCNTSSLDGQIEALYENVDYTYTGHIIINYEPITTSKPEPITISGNFTKKPNYYVTHTYSCNTLGNYDGYWDIDYLNQLHTDTVYLFKNQNNIFEVCRKY